MAKQKRKAKPAPQIIAPNAEQIDSFERALLAYKRVIAITRLRQAGTLTQRQYDALARYRDIATAEDRSYTRDSLDKALHGRSNGSGLPPACLRTAQELRWLEKELGSLQPIARAIAVDDLSISQWAMKQAGAIQRDKPGAGRSIITWFEPRRKAKDSATMDIRMAGERLASAIGA